jgi:membrane-associated protease RseP (regulator of RpoE activity)
LTEPPVAVADNGPGEQRKAVLLFLATFACVFSVYGFQWAGSNPFTDGDAAWASAKFAIALMSILLAHEMAHYWVALRHGFSLSLPYFLPFPAAFGTFGAIIRLRSLPQSRTGLLEMGAAGPLAGFIVAIAAIALGLPATVESAAPEMIWDPAMLELLSAPVSEPGPVLAWLDSVLSAILPEVAPGEVQFMVLANPPIMDILGEWVLGQAPSRYATLDPLATAGWVGCLLTAINLIPIGQLDGGHILNAIAPRYAAAVSRVLLGAALLGGFWWGGWVFWAVMLLILGAWMSLPVPETPPLSRRAWIVAAFALVSFMLSFMPQPVELESLPLSEIRLLTPDGEPISEADRTALTNKLKSRLDREASER